VGSVDPRVIGMRVQLGIGTVAYWVHKLTSVTWRWVGLGWVDENRPWTTLLELSLCVLFLDMCRLGFR